MEIEETSENNVQNEVVELEEVVSFANMTIGGTYSEATGWAASIGLTCEV